MPTLADTLSALLAQATRARVAADRETARIALMYQQDELLRTMPVPRFRLPTLTIDLPVAVASLTSPPPESVEVLPQDALDRWRDLVLETVAAHLAASRYELLEPASLATPLDGEVARWRALRTSVPFVDVRDAITAVLAPWPETPEVTSPVIPDDALPQLRTKLRDLAVAATETLVVAEPAPPPPTPPPADVSVEIGTIALRELGAGAPLTTLRLQISEEGVEVTHVEQDGAISRRLTPE